DRAALARLRCDAPEFSARLAHYFAVDNVIDEFAEGGQLTLVNLTAHLRTEALAPYPDLRRFYLRFAPRIVIDSRFIDEHGNSWFHVQFERGRHQVCYGPATRNAGAI